MDIQEASFYWMAGLLEGEGSFGLLPPAGTGKTPNITISLSMRDEDIVTKVGTLLSIKPVTLVPKNTQWNTLFIVRLRGKRAYRLMEFLQPHMSQRRQTQITNALQGYHYSADQYGQNNPNARLTLTEVQEIRQRIADGQTAKEIAVHFNVSHFNIWAIRSGKTWRQDEPGSNDDEKQINLIEPISPAEQKFYWLAGLLEGEGSFMAPSPSSPNQPRISLQMTDEDVVAKAAQLFEKKYHRIEPKKPTHKAVYMLTVKGTQAAAWMKQLVPLMSRRRQEQIERALENYRPRQSASRIARA